MAYEIYHPTIACRERHSGHARPTSGEERLQVWRAVQGCLVMPPHFWRPANWPKEVWSEFYRRRSPHKDISRWRGGALPEVTLALQT